MNLSCPLRNQDRAAAPARRQVAHFRLPQEELIGRHPPRLHRGRRHRRRRQGPESKEHQGSGSSSYYYLELSHTGFNGLL